MVKKKQKCYIYTRVSTAIQVDGYSLDAQKEKLRKFCQKRAGQPGVYGQDRLRPPQDREEDRDAE